VPLRTPADVIDVLAASPARLTAVGTGPALDHRPSPQEWSAGEVLAHLRSCGEVWGTCIRRILAEDEPTIRAVNPRTWIETTDFAQHSWDEHLAAFTASRAALLAVLRGLAPADWQRRAVVVGAGRPVERTVLSYGEWLAAHERPHVEQVERAAPSG
jgi:hypothetical protein